MFKWIRGFITGVVTTIYANTVLLLVAYITLIKDGKGSRKRTTNYHSYRGGEA